MMGQVCGGLVNGCVCGLGLILDLGSVITLGPFGFVVVISQGPISYFAKTLRAENAIFQKYHKDYSCHIIIP